MENTEAKTEVKTAEKKSGGTLKLIFILFILALLGTGGYWVYQQTEQFFAKNPVTPPIAKPLTKSSAVTTNQEEIVAIETPEVVVSLLPPLVADADEVANPALSTELGQETEKAAPPQNNKIFILYMATRDLRDSISTPERFKKELAFVRVVSIDYPELQSKLELLEIASNAGIPTRETLLEDLAVLQENMRSKNHGSFVANVQNSLSKLIVISKIEGEVKSNDYNSIIKRAEIALERNDLAKALQELQKLGPDAKEVADKISSLNNARGITEYLVDFAKSKIASE